MAIIDNVYQQMCTAVKEKGYSYSDTKRDIECVQLSSMLIDFPLVVEMPILTLKKMYLKGIVGELLWFLRGDDNIKYLKDNNISIWDKDAYNFYLQNSDKEGQKDSVTFLDYVKEGIETDDECYDPEYTIGDVGRNYGVQWRNWQSITPVYIDQISNLLKNLVKFPMSRRHIVTAWNPAELRLTALPACHWAFEIIVKPLFTFERMNCLPQKDEELDKMWKEEKFEEIEKILDEKGIMRYGFSLKFHMRSCDLFLGLPFNIASYGILSKLIEGLTGFKALNLIADLSNVHFYKPHLEVVEELLKRDKDTHKSCQLNFSEGLQINLSEYQKGDLNFDEFIKKVEIKDFNFENYESFDTLKAEMFAPKK